MENQEGDEPDFGLNEDQMKIWNGKLSLDEFLCLNVENNYGEILDYLEYCIRYLEVNTNPYNLVSKSMEKFSSDRGLKLQSLDHNAVNHFVKKVQKRDVYIDFTEWEYIFYLAVHDLLEREKLNLEYTKNLVQKKDERKNFKAIQEGRQFGSVLQQRLFKIAMNSKQNLALKLSETINIDRAENKKYSEYQLVHISQFILELGAVILEKLETVDECDWDDYLEKMGVLSYWAWDRHLFQSELLVDSKNILPVARLLDLPLRQREWRVTRGNTDRLWDLRLYGQKFK